MCHAGVHDIAQCTACAAQSSDVVLPDIRSYVTHNAAEHIYWHVVDCHARRCLVCHDDSATGRALATTRVTTMHTTRDAGSKSCKWRNGGLDLKLGDDQQPCKPGLKFRCTHPGLL